MFSASPSPALCRRGCTVPGEGWSPAETEHSGETPRRRRGSLRWRIRCASPFAAAWNGPRTARDDRGAQRGVARRASLVVPRQRAAALAVGAFPGRRRRGPNDVVGRVVGDTDDERTDDDDASSGRHIHQRSGVGSRCDQTGRGHRDGGRGDTVRTDGVQRQRARSSDVVRRGASRPMR